MSNSNINPSSSISSTLSPTAPEWNGTIDGLISAGSWREQQIHNFQESIKHENSLALSAESCADPIEAYLAIKYHDRLLAAQNYLLENAEIEEELEWSEISTLLDIETENMLEIERESFRTELLKDENQLPIIPQEMIGMAYQLEEIEWIEGLLAEFGEKKPDFDVEDRSNVPPAEVSSEKIEKLLKEQRRIAATLMKTKLADGKTRRVSLAEWPPLPSIPEEDELVRSS